MKNLKIENELIVWFDKMLSLYSNLSFRFEYSETYGVYIVSYDAPIEVLQENDFCDEIVSFENHLDKLFGAEAPLFTEKEIWFSVSENASIREKKAMLITLRPQRMVYDLTFDNSVMSYSTNSYDCFTPLAA